MIQKLLKGVLGQRTQQRETELYRNLMRHEAQIGGQVLGDVPPGHRREFFCLDEHTWVWHEEWIDQDGQHVSRTTRYDLRPDGILKSQNGHYQRVNSDEAERLRKAIRLYVKRLNAEMYGGLINA